MRHFAIIGSGPAGFYTAEALAKAYGEQARIDLIDKYPVPYGLIRFGVAPDHQSIKAVSKRYDKVADDANVRFVGNVGVGEAVSVDELRGLYDAVILATGAPHDRGRGRHHRYWCGIHSPLRIAAGLARRGDAAAEARAGFHQAPLWDGSLDRSDHPSHPGEERRRRGQVEEPVELDLRLLEQRLRHREKRGALVSRRAERAPR